MARWAGGGGNAHPQLCSCQLPRRRLPALRMAGWRHASPVGALGAAQRKGAGERWGAADHGTHPPLRRLLLPRLLGVYSSSPRAGPPLYKRLERARRAQMAARGGLKGCTPMQCVHAHAGARTTTGPLALVAQTKTQPPHQPCICSPTSATQPPHAVAGAAVAAAPSPPPSTATTTSLVGRLVSV